MNKINNILLTVFFIKSFIVIGLVSYNIATKPEPKIQRKKIDGCRWIKFPGETWQHNPNCDSECH